MTVPRATQTLFVTGTDTGVGKTFVTCGLARRARELGKRVFAFKPIETGCVERDGVLIGEDQELLVAAAGGWQQGSLRGLYRFTLPAAPLVAAQAVRGAIETEPILATLREGASQSDLVLVEGAGGWRVPVTETLDMGGLAAVLTADVVLVARAGLGTINHSLLSLDAIERDGGRVAALVLSRRPDDPEWLVASNVVQISRCWGGRVVVYDGGRAALDALFS